MHATGSNSSQQSQKLAQQIDAADNVSSPHTTHHTTPSWRHKISHKMILRVLGMVILLAGIAVATFSVINMNFDVRQQAQEMASKMGGGPAPFNPNGNCSNGNDGQGSCESIEGCKWEPPGTTTASCVYVPQSQCGKSGTIYASCTWQGNAPTTGSCEGFSESQCDSYMSSGWGCGKQTQDICTPKPGDTDGGFCSDPFPLDNIECNPNWPESYCHSNGSQVPHAGGKCAFKLCSSLSFSQCNAAVCKPVQNQFIKCTGNYSIPGDGGVCTGTYETTTSGQCVPDDTPPGDGGDGGSDGGDGGNGGDGGGCTTWTCGPETEDDCGVQAGFNSYWCNGQARWKWEAAGNSSSCGGNPSSPASQGCGDGGDGGDGGNGGDGGGGSGCTSPCSPPNTQANCAAGLWCSGEDSICWGPSCGGGGGDGGTGGGGNPAPTPQAAFNGVVTNTTGNNSVPPAVSVNCPNCTNFSWVGDHFDAKAYKGATVSVTATPATGYNGCTWRTIKRSCDDLNYIVETKTGTGCNTSVTVPGNCDWEMGVTFTQTSPTPAYQCNSACTTNAQCQTANPSYICASSFNWSGGWKSNSFSEIGGSGVVTSFSEFYQNELNKQHVVKGGKLYYRAIPGNQSGMPSSGSWTDVSNSISIGEGTITGFSSHVRPDGSQVQHVVRGGQVYTRVNSGGWGSFVNTTDNFNNVGNTRAEVITNFDVYYVDGYAVQYLTRGNTLWYRNNRNGWTTWADVTSNVSSVGTGNITAFDAYVTATGKLQQIVIKSNGSSGSYNYRIAPLVSQNCRHKANIGSLICQP